jgi:hypothetical protein
MFGDGFSGVFGARWIEPTIVEGENGREQDLVQSYEKEEWVSHGFSTN